MEDCAICRNIKTFYNNTFICLHGFFTVFLSFSFTFFSLFNIFLRCFDFCCRPTNQLIALNFPLFTFLFRFQKKFCFLGINFTFFTTFKGDFSTLLNFFIIFIKEFFSIFYHNFISIFNKRYKCISRNFYFFLTQFTISIINIYNTWLTICNQLYNFILINFIIT